MKRNTLIFAALFSVSLGVFASGDDHPASSIDTGFYVTTNIVSPFTMFNFEKPIVDYVLLILSDTEVGASLNAGYFFDSFFAVEARLSLGPNNRMLFASQFQLGGLFFPLDLLLRMQGQYHKGLYAGAFIRFKDRYYRDTDVHYFNLAPSFALGYWFQIGRLIIDVRANQIFAMASWSTVEHSVPGVEWTLSPFPMISGFLPTLSVSVGWKI